ncbi:Protein preY, mitochondrial [Varanus komodoensis]|uniref:Protein preY, mitochondrial n=1 Tax=Varanus komodoensis TaxID=61221 RepID=A0A8D2L3F3_VARKO|nr:protein preY, mitochondrial isoform X1 [Varanus komodoensis]KAF7252522.1 Protein preY, mitochondrial [Varanus komodoensis]
MQALPRLRLLTRPARRGTPPGAPAAAAARRARCAAATNEGSAAGPGGEPPPPPEPGLLQILVCPLSKKPLRYEESTNELINEELGIAYPIIDGIPNMIPQAARMIGKDKQKNESEQT